LNANFGEELVYWYLRLNGFFTIKNFVLHHNASGRTSDADILAVRFPYVYEETGGREHDWDDNLFCHFNRSKIIGLICEVKTGLNFKSEKLFDFANVEKALLRFGFIENMASLNRQFTNTPSISIQNYEIHKVLFSRKRESPRNDCLHIRLIDVKKFVHSRMSKYIDRKLGDRMFFQSPLLQYIIWEESQKHRHF